MVARVQATEWARYMVAECGLDEEIGPVHISDRSAREGQLSELLKQRVDEQVRRGAARGRRWDCLGAVRLVNGVRTQHAHALALPPSWV